jgi:hypothetical protein
MEKTKRKEKERDEKVGGEEGGQQPKNYAFEFLLKISKIIIERSVQNKKRKAKLSSDIY